MKRLWVILFVVPIFSQSPCNDNKLVRLVDIVQKEGQSSLSDKDFLYYINNKNKCPQLNPTLKIINTRKESNRELETQSSSISLCKNSRYIELKSKKKDSLSLYEQKELSLLRNLCFKEIDNPNISNDIKRELIQNHKFELNSYINSVERSRQEAKAQQSKQQTSNCLSAIGVLALIGAAAYVASESTEGGSYEYVDYKWDQFYNQYGILIWRCRTDGGPNAGQFASDYKCLGKSKVDSRWPDKRAN